MSETVTIMKIEKEIKNEEEDQKMTFDASDTKYSTGMDKGYLMGLRKALGIATMEFHDSQSETEGATDE